MTFIWDDLYWHVVGKDDEYDKNRFAVVRTLFIQLNWNYYYYSKALKTFNRVTVRKEFENYGAIESVKMLKNEKPEAYVTFVDNKSAAMAFGLMNCENDLKITEREYLCFKKYLVHIANTWHQPVEDVNDKSIVDFNSAASDILNLNDDCLRHIFMFCDLESLVNLSQVCKTFNDLLSVGNGSITYRKFTTLRLIVDVIEKDRFGKLMTLGKARKLLRRVGPFITKLIIKKLDQANVARYFQKIVQYAGECLHKMEIYDICLTEHLLAILHPIFQQLSVLKIRLFSNNNEIDFQAICPNLKKLKISGIMNFERSCKHWQNLQHISLLSDIILPETFCRFITINPHLQTVKFFHQNVQQIEAVATNLLNVKKIEIDCKYKPISAVLLSQLGQLKYLVQLTLLNLADDVSVVEIFLTLIKFNELRVLKLHVSENQNHATSDDTINELRQQTLAALSYKLKHLEKLSLFNIKLDESTIFDIVRSANQLQAFHIHGTNVLCSCSLISGIVNIRKLQQQVNLLKLYLDTPNESIAKEDQNYLRIYCDSFLCNHTKVKHYKK
ncbi:hypothetical protein Bhyg_11670 [Pseudolycoriella hygida]|uniref:F-box domain-containing protein n=1 Tax=Pseudolycoriella hygida TaxID=35572 RepID=A0A9Q0MVS7_9DIPT|nr:hypothetical protein Bhyg_11670 [Pseudolycoriella hygida]